MLLKFKSEISDEILGDDTRGSSLLLITVEKQLLGRVSVSPLVDKDVVKTFKPVSLGNNVRGGLDDSKEKSRSCESLGHLRLMAGKETSSTFKTGACEAGDFSNAGVKVISDKREATSSTLGRTLEVGLLFLPIKQNIGKKKLNRGFLK